MERSCRRLWLTNVERYSRRPWLTNVERSSRRPWLTNVERSSRRPWLTNVERVWKTKTCPAQTIMIISTTKYNFLNPTTTFFIDKIKLAKIRSKLKYNFIIYYSDVIKRRNWERGVGAPSSGYGLSKRFKKGKISGQKQTKNCLRLCLRKI